RRELERARAACPAPVSILDEKKRTPYRLQGGGGDALEPGPLATWVLPGRSPLMIALHRAPRRDSLAFVLVVFGSVFASTVPVEAVEAELLELPERLAERDLAALQTAIEQIHARAARSREAWTEADLQKKVPERFLALDAKLAKVKDPKARAKAMVELALLWAELAWVERIDPLVEAIAKDDADLAARLGSFAASENVFARVVGADPKYARAAVDLVEAAHEG